MRTAPTTLGLLKMTFCKSVGTKEGQIHYDNNDYDFDDGDDDV